MMMLFSCYFIVFVLGLCWVELICKWFVVGIMYLMVGGGGLLIDFFFLFGDLGLFGFDVVCWCVYVDFMLMMMGGIVVLLL